MNTSFFLEEIKTPAGKLKNNKTTGRDGVQLKQSNIKRKSDEEFLNHLQVPSKRMKKL